MSYSRLVAPTVSLFAVLALLLGGRTYDGWVVKPPPCSLRTMTGIPCIGCGGTRAMKALAHGEFVAAVKYNPLVVLGVLVVMLWFAWTVATMKMARYQRAWVGKSNAQTDRKVARYWGIGIAVLVLLNWIYLICYLPL